MNNIFKVIITALVIFNYQIAISQVGINDNNATPDASAMLDVKSTTKGMLIPRMTTTQRDAISSTATGLMIYNTTTNAFNYYNGTVWVALSSGNTDIISDADGDTKIQVEKTADEDSIRFDIKGSERLVLRQNANGLTLINLPNNNRNTFLGLDAGKATSSGYRNTFVGYQAGAVNTNGAGNTFLGHFAGKSSTTSTYNIFIGAESGKNNVSGASNTFLGYGSGLFNVTGSNNVNVGMGAGGLNTSGSENVIIGTSAGFSSTSGSGNVFIGNFAGYSEMGNNKLYIENTYNNPPLIYGEFDNDLLQINGTLKLVDGTQGIGKVLVSDASGQATWTDLSEISNSHDTTQPTAIKYRGYLIYIHPTDNATTLDWATAKTTCSNLTAFGKSDWYLPSRTELDAMYKQSYLISGLSETEIVKYWSSTAKDATYAYTQRLDYGGPDPDAKTDTSGHNCRCVRKN